MNRLLLVLFLIFCFGPAVSADEGSGGSPGGFPGRHRGFDRVPVLPGVLDDRPAPKKGPCSELQLDKNEVSKLKEAYFKFKDEKIDLGSRIQKARLKYKKVESDKSSDLAAAQDASQEVVSAVTAMLQAKQSYRNSVEFEILKPEQRGIARACEMSMRRHRFWHMHSGKSGKVSRGEGRGESSNGGEN